MPGSDRSGFFAVLVLLAALALGGAAIYLLKGESQRFQQAFEKELAFNAGQLADRLGQMVQAEQAALSQLLLTIDADRPVAWLKAARDSNPMIRNVFVWDPNLGLVYPDPGMPSTEENHMFISRFGNFFREAAWLDYAVGGDDETREALLSYQQNAMPMPLQAGWKAWFAESRLHKLGWVQPDPEGPIFGIELEMSYLMARIIPEMSRNRPSQSVFQIIDDSGAVFHQIGSGLADNASPVARIPLGPSLPHWQIAVFGSTVLDSSSFFYGALAVVVLLALLIALCTVILVRQVRAGLRVAQQKTTFVANVSHELKTPLTSIRMFAELLATDRVKDPAKRQHYLGVMVQESERLSRLVNNVLDFSRLEQNRREYQISDVNLKPYLEEFHELKALQLADAQASLTIEVPEVVVRADRDALNQILLNLVDNALKYGRNQDGEALIHIAVANEGERIAIAVEDQGSGVPEGLRRRVFEKFFRGEASLTATTSGSGIGLTLARLLAQGMGGSLNYETAKGGGARFVLRVHAATATAS